MTTNAFMDDEFAPAYAVGDRVIMSNPIDFFDVEDTKVYVVTSVKFVKAYGAFAYRLDNSPLWVNEAWLEPDLFGPQFIEEDKTEWDERKALLLEQDYELASLYDAVQTQDETEIARSKARLAEITSELEALK